MPHIFAQLPFPKASLAVLEVFTTIAGIKLDFTEMQSQVEATQQHLGQILSQVEQAIQQQSERAGEEPEEEQYQVEEERLSREDEAKVEQLFEQAKQDRSTAYELKRLLDQLDVFAEYEDRFLDLFKKTE